MKRLAIAITGAGAADVLDGMHAPDPLGIETIPFRRGGG